MKKNYKLFFIFIAVFFIGLIFLNPNEQRSRKNAEKVKFLKIGMKKEQVLSLMGIPNVKEISYLNNTDSMYFYMPPIGFSEGIYIHFDSTSHIKSFIY
jgi:hypothetical protein